MVREEEPEDIVGGEEISDPLFIWQKNSPHPTSPRSKSGEKIGEGRQKKFSQVKNRKIYGPLKNLLSLQSVKSIRPEGGYSSIN